MKVYLFGNQDLSDDNLAFKVAEKLKSGIPNVEFIEVKPNQDLPFADQANVVVMDSVQGLNQVEIITGQDLERLILFPRYSAHDFDLGFQLKYLQKLGKLGEVTIIGLPQKGQIDYLLIQSIFKKLVAQDIQGS